MITRYIFFNSSRNVLDQFLNELLISGIINPKLNETDGYNFITVEQVKVEDTDGNQKLIYPSRADLDENLDKNIVVEREEGIP